MNKRNSKYFQFKQFGVRHDNSAFKVGFDGILLGAWCKIGEAQRILDIGAGCGLIALIAAQKNRKCRIDAIEPHMPSYDDACLNFGNSPWNDRVKVYNHTLQEFAKGSREKYDHIISNPPFFNASLLPSTDENRFSKHVLALNHDQLIEDSYKLLREDGKLSLILPTSEGDKLIHKSNAQGLQLSRLTRVISKRKDERLLIELKKCRSCIAEINELHIYNPDGSYTDDYIELVRELYLKL